MTQPVLVSFGTDLDILREIRHHVQHEYDFCVESFLNRKKLEQIKGRPVVLLIVCTSANREILEQVSVLHQEYPQFPLLLVAVNPEATAVVMAFKRGVDDLLIYPVTQENLMNSLNRLIHLRKNKPVQIVTWMNKCLGRIRHIWTLISSKPIGKESYPTMHLQVQDIDLTPHNTMPLVTSSRRIAESVPAKGDELEVKLLGNFEISFKNKKLQKWPGQKARSLLAFLLTQHKKNIHKEVLMDKFWPDASPSSARNCLNVAIHSLRKSLATICPKIEIVCYNRNAYSLNPELKINLDIDQFYALWKEGRAHQQVDLQKCIHCYEKAITLYDGDFMESMRYEHWPEMERESLKETYLVMLNTLSQFYFDQKALNQCIALSKLMLKQDHCLEGAHRRLMKCYAKQGLKDKAIRQYEMCKKILQQELETRPSERTELLFKAIKVGIVEDSFF